MLYCTHAVLHVCCHFTACICHFTTYLEDFNVQKCVSRITISVSYSQIFELSHLAVEISTGFELDVHTKYSVVDILAGFIG